MIQHVSPKTATKIEDRRSKIEHVQHFSQLIAWQLAKDLVILIYKITKKIPADEKFGLTSQLRRASVSIASNIAEGFGRRTPKDKSHFYTMACSSADEVESQALITHELELMSEQDKNQVQELCVRVKQTTNALIRSTNQPNFELRTSNFDSIQ